MTWGPSDSFLLIHNILKDFRVTLEPFFRSPELSSKDESVGFNGCDLLGAVLETSLFSGIQCQMSESTQ